MPLYDLEAVLKLPVQVCLQCYLRYGISPSVLLTMAQRGDCQALERLLSLDPAAAHLPELEPVLVERLRRKPVLPAVSAPQSLKLDLLGLKALAASWIQDLSRDFQQISRKLCPRSKAGKLSLADVCELLQVNQKDRQAFRARVVRAENGFLLQLCDIFGG